MDEHLEVLQEFNNLQNSVELALDEMSEGVKDSCAQLTDEIKDNRNDIEILRKEMKELKKIMLNLSSMLIKQERLSNRLLRAI